MSNFYQLRIQYFGSQYFGWQIQADQLTIQGELEKALKRAFPKNKIKTLGASRTDKGVHALDQLCKLSINCDVPEKNLLKAINDQLPAEIIIKEVFKTTEEFHPIYDVKEKTYLYLFKFYPDKPNIFEKKFSHYEPFNLNLEKMNEAAKLFVGEHDFVNYYTLGSEVSTTIRTIYNSEILNFKDLNFPISFPRDVYALKISGNGFLKQMIRLIMGTLIEIGKEKITLVDIEKSLSEKLPRKLSKVLDPRGLFLNDIKVKV